mmetsp:Transcript_18003/g.37211  ORF Transcript_18003/g.37211 Transcript_18003/m.37211 type:complete len:94 (-) Transcript_18003:183-464(-)
MKAEASHSSADFQEAPSSSDSFELDQRAETLRKESPWYTVLPNCRHKPETEPDSFGFIALFSTAKAFGVVELEVLTSSETGGALKIVLVLLDS